MQSSPCVGRRGAKDSSWPAWSRPSPAPALREHLKARVPPYMVPSAFIRLERLPLNANGKVDRQALAALPLEAAAQPAGGFVGARTATEGRLASIWAELLGLERVGIHDDVFDLGAHSLMAMKALAQIRERFSVDLALRNLFERPTIAALRRIDRRACVALARRTARTPPSERKSCCERGGAPFGAAPARHRGARGRRRAALQRARGRAHARAARASCAVTRTRS